MREAYVGTGDPRRAIADGFRSSSAVVTAAALIMTSVFTSFIPAGSATVVPIAFGLAVGVLTDAFVVRMTLIPALLALLGRRAWWLPGALERRLPVVDVEGEVLHRILRHRTWKSDHGRAVVHAPRLTVDGELPPRELTITVDRAAGIVVGELATARLLARQLCGRAARYPEDLTVDDLLLPEQQEAVRRRTALIDVQSLGTPPVGSVDDLVAERARLLVASPGGRRRLRARAREFRDLIDRPTPGDGAAHARNLSVAEAAGLEAAIALAAGATVVVFVVSAAAVVGLVLWFGALAGTFLRPRAPAGAGRMDPVSRTRLAAVQLVPRLVLALAQALVVFVVLLVFRQGVTSSLGFGALTLLGAVVFALVAAALNAGLRRGGTAAFLLLSTLQLAAIGGIVPIQTAPGVLQTLNGLVPLTAFVNGATQFASGGSVHSVAALTFTLLCWGLVALVVVVFQTRRHRSHEGAAHAPVAA